MTVELPFHIEYTFISPSTKTHGKRAENACIDQCCGPLTDLHHGVILSISKVLPMNGQPRSIKSYDRLLYQGRAVIFLCH